MNRSSGILLHIDYGLDKLRFRIPGEQYPGVLADFGNERINQWSTFWFGIDGGKVSFWQHVSDDAGCLTGINKIVDKQPAVTIHIY